MRAENTRARELVQTAKWCGKKPKGLSGPKRCLSQQSELRGWDGHQTGHEMRLEPNDTTDNVLDSGPEEGVVGGSVKRDPIEFRLENTDMEGEQGKAE